MVKVLHRCCHAGDAFGVTKAQLRISLFGRPPNAAAKGIAT